MTVSTSPVGAPYAPRRTLIGRALESATHRSVPVLVVLAIIWAIFYSQSSAYLSFQNLTNLTLQIVTTAILALGVVFVLLVGEIDLSSAVLSGCAPPWPPDWSSPAACRWRSASRPRSSRAWPSRSSRPR